MIQSAYGGLDIFLDIEVYPNGIVLMPLYNKFHAGNGFATCGGRLSSITAYEQGSHSYKAYC